MSDKMELLIEKVLDEIQVIKTEQNKTNIKLENLKTELDKTKTELSNDINKVKMILETEIKPDFKILNEMQVHTNNKLAEHDCRFDELDIKVDRLSAKSLRHSHEIGAFKRKEAHGI